MNTKENIALGEVISNVKGLEKSFNGRTVLKNITFSINRGENLVIMGRSGMGKSVLIKCLVRLIEPDKGEVEIMSEQILQQNEKTLNETRKKIGFLFQSGALYDSMSVRENLEFPIRRQIQSKTADEITQLVEEALENVGLKEAIDLMPSELSGGMRKRISLARTLILRPAIILYDEPTTGLDTITSKEISLLMLDIQKKYNTTSIIITHDVLCAGLTANRILILHEGEIIAEGSFDELNNSPDEKIRSYFK